MNTALRAEETKAMIFISEAHEKFYYEKLKEVRYEDVYHKALVYCLGICNDTRNNVYRIYDFKSGLVKPECLHEGWQTSGSARVVRMAFNLYCNGMPSVSDYKKKDEQLKEASLYSVEELFCCAYAPYFWQAVQIRYPEYAVYNHKLYEIDGQSAGEIEQSVWDYIDFKTQENALDVQIEDVVVTGSRSRGLEQSGSDLDIVVEYKGNEREDSLFEILHEDDLTIGGVPVDINPIKEDKSGTLQTYLPETKQYLSKKQKAQEKPKRISIKEKLKGKQSEVNKNFTDKHKNVVHGKNNIEL